MKIINNHTEYLDAKYKLNQYEFCAGEYMKNNKTNGIPCAVTKTFPYSNEVDNDLRSAVEAWKFKIIPPDKYMLYVDMSNRTVTTWTGQELGKIITIGREFRSNMGDKRQYITILAINHLIYGGYYFKSSGDYARIRKLNK